MLGAIRAFFEAMAALYNYRAASYGRKLVNESRTKIEKYEAEHNKLFSRGTDDDIAAANRMLDKITDEKRHIKYLSGIKPPGATGHENPD